MRFNVVFCVVVLLLFNGVIYAQVGIGTTSPDSSSILDVSSTAGGILAPRMTTAQRLAISNPSAGLMVYDTDLKCMSINQGTPSVPEWICQEHIANSTIPSVTVSTSTLYADTSTNWRTWVDVPGLSNTFTITDTRTIKINWTLFTGQDNSTSSDGFAQMFTVLEINGTRDESSSNYLPMIHNTGGSGYRLLMNPCSYSHTVELAPGTYTIKVKVYVASFLGSTTGVKIGQIFTGWTGGGNMTTAENENAASNKLLIGFL